MSEANSYVLGLLIFVSRSRSHVHLHRYSDYCFNRRAEIDLHRRSLADDQTVPDLPVRTEAGRRITVGEDKAYDTADHVANLRALNVTPHVTQNDSITATGKRHGRVQGSAIDCVLG